MISSTGSWRTRDDVQARPGAPPEDTSTARIVVAPLPNGTGVTFDYEVRRADGDIGHTEQSSLLRTARGLVLVTSHNHASVAQIISESEPGYFAAGDDDAPFPMAIRLDAPEEGRLVYSWSYAAPGEPLEVRDVADTRRVPCSEPLLDPRVAAALTDRRLV